MAGSLVFLNESGDITISWTDDHDAEVKKLIQEKLEQGYSFFMLKPKFLGIWKKELKLQSASDITNKSVIIKDESIEKLFDSEIVQISKTPDSEIEVGERLKDVDDVANNDCVAIRPIAAG